MLMGTPEGFADDVGGFFSPHKGRRVRIPLGKVALDVADEGAHRIERTPADRLAGQNAEPCFVRKAKKSAPVCRARHSPRTLPLATSRAAYKLVRPLRR